MAEPSMETIKASLERRFKNWSLNDQQELSYSTTDDSPEIGDPTLELNSDTSLPFHWEQCLDLKTGEIYYINWRTGMKAKQDPRRSISGDYYYYSSSEDDDESSYCVSEERSESSPSSSKEQWSRSDQQKKLKYDAEEEEEDYNYYYHPAAISNNNNNNNNGNVVLVVSGCKSCFMFHMVPKQLEICPKCCGQLMHV